MSDRYCGESDGGMPGSQMNCGERWNAMAERMKCDKCKAYDKGFSDGSQWIKVADAKPESGSECVIYNGEIMQGVYYWKDPEQWFADYSGSIYNVTHWMQPEPPK